MYIPHDGQQERPKHVATLNTMECYTRLLVYSSCLSDFLRNGTKFAKFITKFSQLFPRKLDIFISQEVFLINHFWNREKAFLVRDKRFLSSVN